MEAHGIRVSKKAKIDPIKSVGQLESKGGEIGKVIGIWSRCINGVMFFYGIFKI